MEDFRVGPWLVEVALNRISHDRGTHRHLEPKVMAVLVCLAEANGSVVSKQQLIRKVWDEAFVTDDVLTRAISELRRAFDHDSKESQVIQTIPKSGYRLLIPVVFPSVESSTGSTPQHHATPGDRSRYRRAALITVLVGAGVFFIATQEMQQRSSPSINTRTLILPPEKASFDMTEGLFALSPDGTQMVYVATDALGKELLWVRPLDSLEAQPLAGTEDGFYPFWSPDSRFVGFFAQGKLRRIPVSGGPAQVICDAEFGLGGSWNKDGTIVFAPSFKDAIFRVRADGGPPVPVTKLDKSRHETRHTSPIFLDDGEHFLFWVRGKDNEELGIHLGSLKSDKREQIFSGNFPATYASGFLLFVRDHNLYAQSFDPGKLEVKGSPRLVADRVSQQFSVSQNGVLAYLNPKLFQAQLAWFDRSGALRGIVGHPGEYIHFELSPDEQRVLLEQQDQETERGQIWVLDLRRGVSSRLHFDAAWEYRPVWSPDGSKVVFSSNRLGPGDLYMMSSISAQEPELLLSGGWKTPWDWSKDGRYILYDDSTDKNKTDLWAWPQFGDRKPFIAVGTQFDDTAGQFSPDGHWLAYVSQRSAQPEVFVRPFPALNSEWQISTNGGFQPKWRSDGGELFYLSPNNELMAVEISTKGAFRAGVPRPLFLTQIRPGEWRLWRHQYAVASHGKQFLMAVPAGGPPSRSIVVLSNWLTKVLERSDPKKK
jgi:eukaryotic-like serine/threonine-protein kinase